VLDSADLVFFDPAGTGFSRVAPGVDPESYFSVAADGQQLAQLVIEWSHLHHRESSPKYLFGESYGTLRAAATANQLQKRQPAQPLAGVIFYPMIALSGLFFPLALLPPWLETVARVLPLTHAVSLMQGMWRGDPLSSHLWDAAVIALVFAACTALSARVFRWE